MISQHLRDLLQNEVREGNAKGVIEALADACKEEGDPPQHHGSPEDEENYRDRRELAIELYALAERTYV